MASTISFLGTRNLNIFQVALLSVVILVFTGAENREVFRDNNLQIHQSPASIKSYEEGKFILHRKRVRRDSCSCNQLGTLYGLCHPLPALNFKCICKRGYTGKYCNECSLFSFGYPNCKSCDCNVFGARVSACHNVTGQCSCKNKIGGRACDSCISGYFRFPLCRECNCPMNRTKENNCNNRTGACLCLEKYEGEYCERCKMGYFDFPECKACNCTSAGSNSPSCHPKTGQCHCKEDFTGLKCERCKNATLQSPDCAAAIESQTTANVSQTTAKEEDSDVKQISKAHNTTTVENNRTKEAIGKENASGSDSMNIYCEGELTCQPVSKTERSSCADLYYNDTESRFSSCAPCGCFGEGTLSSILSCDKSNGKCHCKSHVQGQSCDICKKGYYDVRHENIFGCKACQCNSGGSTSNQCDDFGNCRCRSNIAGPKCDRLRKENYFLPDLFQLKFELEESRLVDGSPAAYGYSQVVFPDFTWKGYITFGDDQEQVSLSIKISKSSHYKVLIRYISVAKQNGFAVAYLSRISSEGSQKYQGNFTFTRTVLRSSYVASDDFSNIFLEAGDWLIRIASKSSGLYLDHIALLPESYYNPNQLLIAIPEPCHAGIQWHESCSMYDNLGFHYGDSLIFPGKSGYILEGSERKPALNYDDPDMLRLLKLETMAMISFNQDTVNFDISAVVTGQYLLIVEYFNADERVYRVNVRFGDGNSYKHHLSLSKCPYSFLCRSVVLSDNNSPSVLSLTKSKDISVKINGNIQGLIGIHRLVAIPVDFFTNEFLQPKFKCLAKDGKCIKSTGMPMVNRGLPMVNYQEGLTSQYKVSVPASTWWVIVMDYRQSKHPSFKAEFVLNANGETTKRYLGIDHCPSETGCRTSVTVYVNKGDLTMTVRRPKQRSFEIMSIQLQRDAFFEHSTINPTHLDLSEEYKTRCLDRNNLPIARSVHQFCRTASFTQISAFNNGARTCSCHPRGSTRAQCEKVGGQCKCHRNIIGRRCQSCRAGFYNFPYCRSCRCFMAGSVSPECNRNGQCKCRPRYGGTKCNRCKSSLFFAFPECKPCDCNTHGALGQFCSSSTGQCQCLNKFRGRKCDMCQVGFYGFPKCVPCTCDAAGIKSDVNGTNGCFPGDKDQCSCKDNVEGMLCDRCKDLYFNLQMSNPKGCLPCKCDTAGTLNGIATCDKNRGQCHCKPNVEGTSRTCDTCKDGFYGLDKNNVFGCKACDCNPGGSSSNFCEKKTGQCPCKPNITGRKCDRLASKVLYVPTIRHLQFHARDGMTVSGKSLKTDTETGFVPLAQHKEPIQWMLTLPKKSEYILILHYKLMKTAIADAHISFLHAIYKSVIFETKVLLKKTSKRDRKDEDGLFVLRKNGREFPLDLYGGSYIMQLSANASDLFVDYISLIPLHYLTGKTLKSNVIKPCSVFAKKEHCVRYSYVSIPRNGIYSMELEGTGRRDAEMLDRSKYPMLNINGAVIIRRNQPFTISFKQPTSGQFIFLLQYFKPENIPIQLSIMVQGAAGRTVGIASLANCPHVFGCRQVMLDGKGIILKVNLVKDVIYTVSFSIQNGGFAALDLLSLIPEDVWSFSFITPSPFCVSWKNKCIKTDLTFPEGHMILPAFQSIGYIRPLFMPPNIRDRNLKPILLHKNKNFVRWQTDLERGYFNILIHYFQPNHESKTVNIIINTQYSSIAGRVRLSYCPHVDGCRAAVLSENSFIERFEGIYVSGNKVRVTFVKLPVGFRFWINYVLFIRPTSISDENALLNDRPINFSHLYKPKCIRNYDQRTTISRTCFNWLFQLIMDFNDGPFSCNCELRGSMKASCNLIGGQCPCKNHVTGRTCSRCKRGRILYPRCTTGNSLLRYFV